MAIYHQINTIKNILHINNASSQAPYEALVWYITHSRTFKEKFSASDFSFGAIFLENKV